MWPQSQRGGHAERPARLVFPLILIVAGVVFLLNNLGVLSWSVWPTLARLWPVILILLGIEILLGRRGRLLSGVVVVVIVLIAVVTLGFALSPSSSSAVAPTFSEAEHTTSVPLGNATSGDVSLTFPAGQLDVGALPAKGPDLLRLTSSTPPGMQTNVRSSVQGNAVEAVLSVGSSQARWWPFSGFGSEDGLATTWTVLLTPGVPLSLRANIGAGQASFDLTNLTVRQLSINSGAGQTTVRFPISGGQTDADIHSGAGQLTLVIPPDVGAYIHQSSAMVDVHIPSDRFRAVADGFQTANYATATNRVDVTLHLGIGSVDVR